jgi:hypothetical protein
LRRQYRPGNRIVLVVAILLGVIAQLLPSQAFAATGFQQAYVRLDRMKANTTTSGMVCATPATIATEASVVITFPSTYTLDTTASHWVLTTTNIPGTAWPGIGSNPTSVSNVAKTITVASTDLTVGTQYCFNWKDDGTHGFPLTTAASAADNQQGEIETFTSTPTTIDLTEIAFSNIVDDHILVTATVPPSFAFTLDNGGGGTSDSFGTLADTPAGVVNSTSGVTGTVVTNAKSGWIAWAKDTDRNPSAQGLRSATAAYTIATAGVIDGTPSTLSGGAGGAEGYGLAVQSNTVGSGCTAATPGEYNDGGNTAKAGTFSNVFQVISQCTGGSPGTSNGSNFVLKERAAITGATPAATDYTDTITVVAAGNF